MAKWQAHLRRDPMVSVAPILRAKLPASARGWGGKCSTEARTSCSAVNESPGKVYLVGAGPGAPDLITLRGADVIRSADVVIYDYLASPEILRLAPAGVELIYAGKIGRGEHQREQAEINQLMIERARAG